MHSHYKHVGKNVSIMIIDEVTTNERSQTS